MKISNQNAAEKVEELLSFSHQKLGLKSEDIIYVRNALLSLLQLPEPAEERQTFDKLQNILDVINRYAMENGLCDKESMIRFETKVMGLVTPLPSKVIEEFDDLAAEKGIECACEYLYKLCIDNNYIRMVDINKNKKWTHTGSHGEITVTINLSKPEKDPKEIAAAKLAPKTGYPKCMLCPTNVGFYGNPNHPARQTLRTIPIRLIGEPWQLQLSPYQYYYQHIIMLSEEHRPMLVNSQSFMRLIEFVDMFPHYFLGSNAALPIVGGSILTHDHYQGGAKVLPEMKAPPRKHYYSEKLKNVSVSTVDWYNSVVRIESKDAKDLLEAVNLVFDTWLEYSDESVGIICKTDEQHNAVTPIARKEGDTFIFDMILRNNRTDDEHPFGIFHPTQDLHNIKKEGIGIIEVMGLFILPGRLDAQSVEIKQYLTGEKTLDFKALSDPENPMSVHLGMIAQLANDFGTKLSSERASEVISDYINDACEKILECTAVFKNTQCGQEAFDRFMKVNFKEV